MGRRIFSAQSGKNSSSADIGFCTSCALLVQELLIAKRELRLSRLLTRLSKYRPLIIDDIGYVQQDREEMEVLFRRAI